MTLIDFYILNTPETIERHQFACRLAEKAAKQGNTVLIVIPDEASAHDLDKLLWSFRPDAFIPHQLMLPSTPNDNESTRVHAPVAISLNTESQQHHDVLINLTSQRPEPFSHFQRLAEIVIQRDDVLEATRNNYSFYKSRGYPINTHKIRTTP